MRRFYYSLLLLLTTLYVFAQAPNGYYDNADGKTGAELKTALYNIIKGHTDVGYNGLYNVYKTSDNLPNNKVWDTYSIKPDGTAAYFYNHSSTDQCGTYNSEGDCYNREHTFCDSWLGTSSPQRSDAHHVIPTDGYVNNRRGSYPHGKVGSASWTSTNGSKLGSSNTSTGYTGTVFEPIDEFKGDFARMYFYMATRYEDKIAGWVNNGSANTILAGNSFPAYKTWFKDLMMQWHNLDPVSQKEIDRNNAVYSYQHNRNPFIDRPEFVDMIWGSGTVSYTITATAGANGSISPSGSVTVSSGQNKTFTITPNTGFQISNVIVNGTSVGAVSTYTFTNVTSNHTISASFVASSYTITATAGANGSISPSGSVSVGIGLNQTFTITPNTGYHIHDVLVNGSSVGAVSTYTFNNVTSNQSISASFAINSYTITASAGANGTISPSGSVTVNYNQNQTFTITPNTGYKIEDVLVNGSSVGAVSTYTFSNVTSNHTISASFEIITYTIDASSTSYGSISPTGDVVVNHGANQTFTITPDADCYITNVLVDGSSVGLVTSYTFNNVTANHTIAANFSNTPPTTYTINSSAGENGTISPSGEVSVTENNSRTFTITPNTNYHIDNVVVDGTSVGAVSSYTFSSVNANHTIHATFAINTYTITATANSNGSISPSGEVVVAHGTNREFTITPNQGYHIKDVTVDGQSVGTVSTYTFENVTASHAIEADFEINIYIISASAGEHGTITPTGEVETEYGSNQLFTITPNVSHVISDVLVDDESIGAVASYTFEDISQDHTIHTSFEIKTFTISAGTDGNGTISPSGNVDVEYGSNQQFTFTPNANYLVHDVLVNGNSIGAVNSFTFENITEDQSIYVNFALVQHIITATANQNGNIDPSGQVYVDHGLNQSFTITPNQGFRIKDVTVNQVSVGNVSTYTFENITQDQSIEAFFENESFTLTITTAGSGSVQVNGEPYTQALTFAPQTIVTLDAEPQIYWNFDSWSGDIGGRDSHITITMNGTKAVTANFTEIPDLKFTLTVNITGNGSVTVNESEYVTSLIFDKGDVVAVNAIPDNGWQFDSWSGDISGRDTPTNLTMIGDKTVNVLFTEYTSIPDETLGTISVHPNPFDSYIQISSQEQLKTIRITNIVGQKVFEITKIMNTLHRIETSNLPKGIYLVAAETTSGNLLIRKVIKR